MILFVFEGKKREPTLFKTLEYLFFPKNNQHIICCYGNNIYNLYKQLQGSDKNLEKDIISVLRENHETLQDNPFRSISTSAAISEIFLFFDYDIHNQNTEKNLDYKELNKQISEMLVYFNDETDNGKLYINYPMVESIRFTQKLPDSDYHTYKIKIASCGDFKKCTSEFSFYPNLDFISFRIGRKNNELKIPEEKRITEVKTNWILLKNQNVCKAQYICTNNNTMPQHKSDINQEKIFKSQLQNYAETDKTVAILNAFPLFIYEYFT